MKQVLDVVSFGNYQIENKAKKENRSIANCMWTLIERLSG